MISTRHFGALLGFLFAAAIAAFGLGTAILCLLVALIFYAAAIFFEGSVGVAEAQERLAAARDGLRGSSGEAPTAGPATSSPPRTSRVR
jgi:hypothetical protein